jgi:pilus assembly protein CpaC
MVNLASGLLMCLGMSLPALAAPAAAPVPAAERPDGTSLVIEAGTGRVLTLPAPASNVFVADPKVAEVRPASATNLFVFGVAAGHTTVAALDATGHVLVQYDLTVQPTAFNAHQAQATIARLIPNGHVQVFSQSKGMLLTGGVPSPADSAQAAAIARGYLAEGQVIDNELRVESPIQVTLQVRIAQMSREVVRKLGVNWSSLGSLGSISGIPGLTFNVNSNPASCGGVGGSCPGINFNAVIDALANDNLARLLAEPNLTVMSGETASFQVGGEFPIPVSSTNAAISVAFKDYGVLLSFVPTVYSNGRINLHVKPEVSEISNAASATVSVGSSTLVIPSLTVRRAETTVELGSGQSFAIAGLLEHTGTDSSTGIPGASDTPIFGALFRDNQFDHLEQELVIVVTPYIVRPVSDSSQLHLPTDGFDHPHDLERLLLMRQVVHGAPAVPVRLPGDAGFLVQ